MDNLAATTTTFDHSPIRPARNGVIGEHVFVGAWAALMRETPYDHFCDEADGMLRSILFGLPGALTQRNATVAASLMRWLGTNNGQAFLASAESLSLDLSESGLVTRGTAYAMAWAKENRREVWMSDNLRTIEMMLSPHANTDSGDQSCRLNGISQSDSETVETVIVWLAEGRGTEFLATCAVEIKSRCKAQREIDRAARLASFNAQNTDPCDKRI